MSILSRFRPVKQGPFRTYFVVADWPTYGSPSLKRVRRLLRKFFNKAEVEEIIVRQLLPDQDRLFLNDAHQAKKLARRLRRLMGKKANVQSYRTGYGYMFWPDAWELYVPIKTLSYCRECKRLDPPRMRTDDGGAACRRDRTPLVTLDSMPMKEAEKHVRKALKERTNGRVGVDSDFDEMAA